MSERYIYTVFSVHTAMQTGMGSDTATISGLPDGEDRLTLKEIRELEAQFLASCRMDNPQVTRVILTSWQWLRSNEGFAPALAEPTAPR